ncbi:MAG: amino acid adenylation domain-containing protein [Bacteroidia bacterium]
MENWKNKSVIEIFEEQVELVGDNIALKCDNTTLNYIELNKKANSLARLLSKAYNIQKGDIVGLLIDKSDNSNIAIIAILKCGASYLPISNDMPEERTKYIISSSGTKLVISTQSFANYISSIGVSTLNLNSLDELIYNIDTSNLNIEIKPDDRAYIIYTSGTTGTPNGVEIPHRGIVRLVKGDDYFPFAEKNNFLQLSNIGFDAATFEIWGALLNGNRLIVSNQKLTDLLALEEAITQNEVTVIFLTSSFFNLIVDDRIQVLAGLRYLLVGGEALSVKHIHKARLAYPKLVLINGYGPTECTTFACCYRISNDFDFDRSSIPIGYAITETQLYILDDKLNEVAADENGELYLGGSGLALGYLNNKDLSNSRFIQHPQNKEVRLYKTGDICRVDRDGTVIYIGRTDNQLKIRGFRVETEEIEHKIRNHNLVSNCVVIGIKSDWSTDLVAFITAKNAPNLDDIQSINNIDIKSLKQELSGWLPLYMIPAIIVELNKLPLNKNGKADKEKLKSFLKKNESLENEIQFSNRTEEKIYKIWEKHFSNSRIRLDDSFFDLGGDSLQALSLINDINTQFGLNISTLSIYKTSTIKALASVINNECKELKTIDSIYKIKDGEGDPLFLAAGLGGDAFTFIYFTKFFNKNIPIYNLNYPDESSVKTSLTMEDLANNYVIEILRLLPCNRVNLLGYSFGGRLVFEIALQLQKKGIEVGILTIIDIVSPSFAVEYLTPKEIVKFEAYLLKYIDFSTKFIYLRKRLPELTKIFIDKKLRLHKNTASKNGEAYTNDSFYHKLYYNYLTNEKYIGNILLFRSTQTSASPYRKIYYLNLISPLLFWDKSVEGNIKKIELNCGHTDFLKKENVKDLIFYIEKEMEILPTNSVQ